MIPCDSRTILGPAILAVALARLMSDLFANAAPQTGTALLTVFRADLLSHDPANWEELFAGYTTLKAITFSSSMELRRWCKDQGEVLSSSTWGSRQTAGTEIGLAIWIIRLRAQTAMATSPFWPAVARALSFEPTMCLKRPIVVSTRLRGVCAHASRHPTRLARRPAGPCCSARHERVHYGVLHAIDVLQRRGRERLA